MTARTEFHLRVQDLLEQAVRLQPAQRDSFIRRQCPDDPELQEEARALLPGYLRTVKRQCSASRPVVVRQHAPAQAIQLPRVIKEYRLVQVLGCGGMGVVCHGVHVRMGHSVAIKLLRRASAAPEWLRRFAFEVEVLRNLHHPGIAGMNYADDVVIAERPWPYFVMEYVTGEPLTCHARRLGTAQQLELFARVCDAVDYAHDRGVIHRDLKPQNILVDAHSQPKILDFGIARVVDFQSTLLPNERDRFVGTRKYASPEQRAGRVERITPRSDVYTLGLLLHEVLTGTLPQPGGPGLAAAVAEVGVNLNLKKRTAEFRYGLQQILSCALAGEPRRRFASAGALGSAIRRLLQTVQPPTGFWEAMFQRERPSPTPPGNPLKTPLSAVMRRRLGWGLQRRAPDP